MPKYEEIGEPKVFPTRYNMIDFKNIYQVKCDRILASEKEMDAEILKSAILRLTIQTRNELRDKILKELEYVSKYGKVLDFLDDQRIAWQIISGAKEGSKKQQEKQKIQAYPTPQKPKAGEA
jgi:hypothetical protein